LELEPEGIQVQNMVPVDLSCTADSPEPIALYIMLDNSGSMSDNNKWPDAVNAITAFAGSDPTLTGTPWSCVDKDGKSATPPAGLAPPGSGAVSVALQYFHPQDAGRNVDECDGVAHSKPAVPMGPLPANGPAIVQSLNSTGPRSDTPTVGALTGGTDYCVSYQAMNPGKKCVVVLVTDGQPNGCGLSSQCSNGGGGGNNDCVDPNSASVLVPIASNAFMANGVLTFTVGMNGVTPDGFTLLDQIAVAGGSDCTPGTPGNEACNITAGAQGLLDALNTIRKSVQVTKSASQAVSTTMTQTTTLECQWGIPKPSSGQMVDTGLVNVSFTTGGNTESLGNVPSQTDCAAAGGGWYYDNPAAPARIVTCPQTCTSIQAARDAKVEILVGCATQPATVR
jgi:hypothetical protein